EAGLTEKAVHYWHHAGQSALERSAHVEAIAHLRQGLELLETLPETPQRLQRQVDLPIALGASLIATKGSGAPEVEQTYRYARQQQRASAFLYGEDAGVVCRSRGAWALWCLGYPNQGLVQNDEGVTLAQQIAHPYSLDYALGSAAVFHQYRREVRATRERAE